MGELGKLNKNRDKRTLELDRKKNIKSAESLF